MPYTGKPSGACQQCKQRHAKCDEVRPTCGRCVQAKRVCSGWREGLDLVLRDQTVTAEATVKRRQNIANKSRSVSPSVPRFLIEDEESRALTFFVSSWVLFPHDPKTDHGITELLPYFFGDLKSGKSLYLALAATSRLLFAAWELRIRDIETPRVKVAYGKALKATRLALEDPIECSKDETLMSVLLLGLYEAAVYAFKGQISPVRHYEGAAAVLVRQAGTSTRSELSTKLLKAVRNNLVFRAMQSKTPIDTRSTIWSDDIALRHNPATLLDVRFTEVANVLALESSLLAYRYGKALPVSLLSETAGLVALDIELRPKSGFDEISWISHLISQAKTVDLNLAAWLETIPSSWLPNRIAGEFVPPTVREAGMYRDCDIYPDILVATTWNEWRAARLKVLALIARYQSDDQVLANIQLLADDICASLPFHLGDRTEMTPMYVARSVYPSAEGEPIPQGHHQNATAFGGWYIYAPLREITNVSMHLREGQLMWVLGQLKRLAKIHDVVMED